MDRLHAIYVIGKMDFISTLKSRGLYLVLIFSFLLTYLMISVFVADLSDPNSLSGINDDILSAIFMISVVGVSFLYLATTSVTSIARERGYKTIEILFYGPVDEFSFILGKFAGKLFTCIFFLIVSILFIFMTSIFMHFSLSLNLLKIAVLSMFLLSCIISLGIFLSTLTSSTAGSIALIIGFFIGLFILRVMGAILGLIPDFNSEIVLIRDATVRLINITKYISPVEYLFIGWGSIKTGENIRYLMSSLYSVFYSMTVLALSSLLLKKKGIR